MQDAFGVDRSDISKAAFMGAIKTGTRVARVSRAGGAPMMSSAVKGISSTFKKAPVATLATGGLAGGGAAFGLSRMSKSDEISKGDKKKTKYAAAGLAGSYVGSRVGARGGARLAGTTMKDINTGTAAHVNANLPNEVKGMVEGSKANAYKTGAKVAGRAIKATKGARTALAGSGLGAVAGAGLATAAYAQHRKNKYGPVAKSAFGVDHEVEKGMGSMIAGGAKKVKGVASSAMKGAPITRAGKAKSAQRMENTAARNFQIYRAERMAKAPGGSPFNTSGTAVMDSLKPKRNAAWSKFKV